MTTQSARAARRIRIRRGIQLLSLALFVLLFFGLAWPYADPIHASAQAAREWLPFELFLWLDPLIGIASALAARCLNPALPIAVLVWAAGVVVPRAFCCYVCPLGTLQDGFDACIGRWIPGGRLRGAGGWRHLRFYLLAAVLAAALLGVMLAGWVAPLSTLTRGLMFSAGRAQVGVARSWELAGPFTMGAGVAAALLLAILLMGIAAPRFWCRYACPTGALISLASFLRRPQRRVLDTCRQCGQCAARCPFDAIQLDAAVRLLDCACCQACARACPAGSIEFAISRAKTDPDARQPSRTGSPSFSRRAWVVSVAGGAAAAAGIRTNGGPAGPPLRPPGSVSEDRFLALCVRCGECFKVCPGSVLQPADLSAGIDSWWTPVVTPTQAGCHPDCSFCTRVCPTGAIRPLTLEAKRRWQMGVARLDASLCLPHRGERECQLCYDECQAAGYKAIEMRRIELDLGDVPPGAMGPDDLEAMRSIQAPFVIEDACVGCGLCEYRCHATACRQQGWLDRRAIVVAPARAPGLLPR